MRSENYKFAKVDRDLQFSDDDSSILNTKPELSAVETYPKLEENKNLRISIPLPAMLKRTRLWIVLSSLCGSEEYCTFLVTGHCSSESSEEMQKQATFAVEVCGKNNRTEMEEIDEGKNNRE
ncbi:hypothetical protein T11_4190 [Trichinella zimbabwensis]|uniref:Uncharacterized protein n=1 Tax=Trichinella zimbabwensis TaxID=268475 RepID=A0A0V1HYZ1_9BILA|nr:hypothetical protein T11_4190 [Trichinella zimbabwensis]